ncbi:U-box domain-containing protein 33-like [Salvia miltiorrhiza]|uniref:U-box domain-containing protein 33-like n=1 Tax=Salvia miltiorrhiza TaxID=226208 RepID=UPI0025AB5EC5|nr:U-box domain-containing protein 33-like [Salvia miltiorrhiza]
MECSSGSRRDEWGSYGVSEIEEEVSRDELEENSNQHGVFKLGSIREEDLEERENVVYVAVWKDVDETLSMDALVWTLNNAVIDPSSALVFLVHVFPETKYIPSPLGRLPINQVNPEQKEMFLAEESGKRRDLLQKFVNVCSSSQVKVETVLIESDMEAKAILDLIPILNIRKLVLGASKASLRRMRSKKGNGAADQIVQKAPEFCEVKIICEGKEISEVATMETPSPSPSSSPRPAHSAPNFSQNNEHTTNGSIACGCFKI